MYFFLCARECPDEKPSTYFISAGALTPVSALESLSALESFHPSGKKSTGVAEKQVNWSGNGRKKSQL